MEKQLNSFKQGSQTIPINVFGHTYLLKYRHNSNFYYRCIRLRIEINGHVFHYYSALISKGFHINAYSYIKTGNIREFKRIVLNYILHGENQPI